MSMLLADAASDMTTVTSEGPNARHVRIAGEEKNCAVGMHGREFHTARAGAKPSAKDREGVRGGEGDPAHRALLASRHMGLA